MSWTLAGFDASHCFRTDGSRPENAVGEGAAEAKVSSDRAHVGHRRFSLAQSGQTVCLMQSLSLKNKFEEDFHGF